jgi:cupin 2 domain-containing protein
LANPADQVIFRVANHEYCGTIHIQHIPAFSMSPSVTGNNLLSPPLGTPGAETSATLLRHPAFTLEHIVSRGGTSPDGFWYDQERAEWVLLLRGHALLRFESGESRHLTAGDPLLIPAHCRHRVDHSSPDALWLALHYQQEPEAD